MSADISMLVNIQDSGSDSEILYWSQFGKFSYCSSRLTQNVQYNKQKHGNIKYLILKPISADTDNMTIFCASLLQDKAVKIYYM